MLMETAEKAECTAFLLRREMLWKEQDWLVGFLGRQGHYKGLRGKIRCCGDRDKQSAQVL